MITTMQKHLQQQFPPEAEEPSDEHINHLLNQARDWQVNNGLLLTRRPYGSVYAEAIGTSLFPTPFPAGQFYKALKLQELFNEIYMRISGDPEWLFGVLKDGFPEDSFAELLWQIHEEVESEGYVQDLSLGIFRSDYMLHMPVLEDASMESLQLKQVEFNTYSVAGGTHAHNITRLHQYLKSTGDYTQFLSSVPSLSGSPETNDNVKALANALVQAHEAYGPPKNPSVKGLAILFVVQPRNVNVCDERPIEYLVSSSSDPPIPVHRIEYFRGGPILKHTSLGPSRELLYHHPTIPGLVHEISVVYQRAGYEPTEYPDGITGTGAQARLLLERSLAIKCPSILGHLAGCKKVQAALTNPEVLDRFLPHATPGEKNLVTSTFMPMHTLNTDHGLALALSSLSSNHVLKPNCREGGGNNIFGPDIPDAVGGDTYSPLTTTTISESERAGWVIMEMIQPPVQRRGYLVYAAEEFGDVNGEVFSGETVGELGVFGTCFWRMKKGNNGLLDEIDDDSHDVGKGKGKGKAKMEDDDQVLVGVGDGSGSGLPYTLEIVQNHGAVGWSMKTKDAEIDEMSVVKGYGCFSTVLLV